MTIAQTGSGALLVRAALTVFFAMTLIVIGDAAGKTMTGGEQSPFFVAWSRFVVAALLLYPLFRPSRDEWRQFADWRVLLRGGLITCAICLVLTALRTEPIANVFGGFFVGPVIAYILSSLLLGERVSLVRSLLLAVGFVGVLLVVKPGFGASIGMGFAVLAGCFHGCYLVANRWLSGVFPARFLLFSQLVVGAVALAPLGVAGIPAEPDLGLVVLITISALGSAFGNYLLTAVNRTTPASVVAPLVYSQLIAATIVGYLVFGDWPDLLALSGLIVILGSGLATLWLVGRGR